MRKIILQLLLASWLLLPPVVMAGQPPPPVQQSVDLIVIAPNAPSWMKFTGQGRYLCTESNVGIQLQAAIDKATDTDGDGTHEVGEGGTVKLSPGLFTVSKPSDATDVVFVADINDGTNEATLVDDSASLDVTTGTFGNIAVGQIYRASGGQDNGDNSVEDNGLDICFTILQKTGASSVTVATWDDSENQLTETGAFTNAAVDDWLYISGGTNVTVGWHQITTVVDDNNVTIVDTEVDDGAGDLAGGDIASSEAVLSGEDFLEDYGTIAGGSLGQPTFVRMIGAIQLKPGVFLEGAGMGVEAAATEIKLADDANCTMVTCEPPTTVSATSIASGHSGVGISKLTLNGNRNNQGDGTALEFHPLCNGILLNDHINDTIFKQIVVKEMRGDCWHINQPWGCVITTGWTRFSNGSGIVYGDGQDSLLLGHKIYQVGMGTDRDEHASNTCPGDTTTFSQVGVRGLNQSNRLTLMPYICGSTRGWAMRIRGNNAHVMGVTLITDDVNADGAILVEGGNNGLTINNCLFSMQVAGTTGIKLVAIPEFTITGNTFDTRGTTPIDLTTGNDIYGTIEGNTNAFVSDSGQSITTVRALMRSERAKNTSGDTIAAKTFCRRNASSGTITIVSGVTTAIDPLGLVVSATTNNSLGPVQTAGYQWKGPIDNSVDYANITVGTELCCTNGTAVGSLEAAGSGDWVIAIMELAYNPPGGGGATPELKPIYILPPGERYLKP